MKKTYVYIVVLVLIIAIGFIAFKILPPTPSPIPEDTRQPVVKEEILDPDAPNMTVDNTDLSLDYRYMGEEGMGFVKVPGNWVNYHVIGQVGTQVSFSDVSGKSVVTLRKEGDSGQGLEELAQASLAALNGADAEITKVNIGQEEGCFYLSPLVEEDSSQAFWVFKQGDEVYTILLTGGTEIVKAATPEIEKSFVLENPNPVIEREELPNDVDDKEQEPNG